MVAPTGGGSLKPYILLFLRQLLQESILVLNIDCEYNILLDTELFICQSCCQAKSLGYRYALVPFFK